MVQIRLQVWILLILLLTNFVHVESLFSMDSRYFDVKDSFEKKNINIKSKIKKKKLLLKTKTQISIGSKGLAGADRGYFCRKFDRNNHYYKKNKLTRSIIFYDNHDECLKTINTKKNNNTRPEVIFGVRTFYSKNNISIVTTGINFLQDETMNLLKETEYNYISIIKHNYKTGMYSTIGAIPMVLYNSNYKEFHKEEEKAMQDFFDKKLNNKDILEYSEEDLKKITDEYPDEYMKENFLNQGAKFYLRQFISDSEDLYNIYKNRKYFFWCERGKVAGGSTVEGSGEKIFVDENLIKKTELLIKNFNSNFTSFHLNQYLDEPGLNLKFNEIFSYCKGTSSYKIQTRD